MSTGMMRAGIFDLPAQLARPRVGGADLRNGVSPAGLDRQSVDHLEVELDRRPRGTRRFRLRAAPARAAPGARSRRARRAAPPPAPPWRSTPPRAAARARSRRAARCPPRSRTAPCRCARRAAPRSSSPGRSAASRAARCRTRCDRCGARSDSAASPSDRALPTRRRIARARARARVAEADPRRPPADVSVAAATTAESKSTPCTLGGGEQSRICLVEPVHLPLHEAAHRFRHGAPEDVEFLRRAPIARPAGAAPAAGAIRAAGPPRTSGCPSVRW